MQKVDNDSQPWIISARADVVFILLPPFFALLLVCLFPEQFKQSDAMPMIYWLFLVVFIDVAHVYSTLFKTYFNPDEVKERRSLLLAVPVFCYVLGVVIYNINGMLFWSILAYLAVFHFIRQQYGFMRLYSRYEGRNSSMSRIDSFTIYFSTIYPIMYWHFNPDRNFNWFIEHDFWQYQSTLLSIIAFYLYLSTITLYFFKEVYQYVKTKRINVPKNLLVLGTALSWYFGIVYFNGDMAFTTLNVISHGIPYMALIWFFERKKQKEEPQRGSKFLQRSFGSYGLLIFILVVVALSYTEEGLWDALVWNEHANLFPSFKLVSPVEEKTLLSLVIPLLALPQATHYVLDGFIWKAKRISN